MDIASLEISAENSPRNTWPLGRVIEVLICKKGLVRRAEVKVRELLWRVRLINFACFWKLELSRRMTFVYPMTAFNRGLLKETLRTNSIII